MTVSGERRPPAREAAPRANHLRAGRYHTERLRFHAVRGLVVAARQLAHLAERLALHGVDLEVARRIAHEDSGFDPLLWPDRDKERAL